MTVGEAISLAGFVMVVLTSLGSMIWWAATVFGLVKQTSSTVKSLTNDVKNNGSDIKGTMAELNTCCGHLQIMQNSLDEIGLKQAAHVGACNEDRQVINKRLDRVEQQLTTN